MRLLLRRISGKQSIAGCPNSLFSAFGNAILSDRGISDLNDLKIFSPSLSVGEGVGGNTYLQIRGIGNDAIATGADPAVAVHLDGVYFSTQNYFDASFFDIERVEVLRGPQGTVYGRNATGGSINVVTNGPSEEFDAHASAVFGDYNLIETQAAIGGALLDEKLLGRLAIFMSKEMGIPLR